MTDKPDTSPQTVERFAQMLETDASDQWTQPCEMTGLLPDDEYNIADTLRALAAERANQVEWVQTLAKDLNAAEAEVARLRKALQALLRFAENTESELGIVLGSANLARAALQEKRHD